MKNFKIVTAFMVITTSGLLFAGNYTSPDINFREKSPSYRPSKPMAFEDSYNISGAGWNKERGIASETEKREPSSVPVYEAKDPEPWLIKNEANQKY